ncbi:MAG: hypothetical protein VX498_06030, partial [Myxococcota bacterium]|nr:hypothetical protein [Myxococcota bacterium]
LISFITLGLALSACTPPPEAPTELGELSLYLFANFEDPDPLVMQAGVLNLLAFLEEFEDGVDLSMDSPATERSWQLPLMETEDWGGADHWEGHDPIDQLPVATAVRSAFGAQEHSELIGLVDQTPLESSSSARYDRSFLTDFDAWLSGDDEFLRTSNSIDRENFLLTLTYTALKDYRKVELPDGGGTAVVGRSWINEQYVNGPGAGTADEDTMDFFSNVELTIPGGEGSLRYNALWGAVVFRPDVDDTILINTVRNGMQEGYENTDAYLAAD